MSLHHKTVSPYHQDGERAEWRVRVDPTSRVVLVFDMAEMNWSGTWEDTGRPLAPWEVRAAAALADLQFEDGRPPPRPSP